MSYYVLIFGTRSSKIKERDYKGDTKCPNCGARNSLRVSGKASYFHLFWIITFPLVKRLVFTCRKCDHVIRPNHEKPESLQRALKTTDKVRRPLWHYTGVVLLAYVVISFVVAFVEYQYYESKIEEEFKAEQQKEDNYKAT